MKPSRSRAARPTLTLNDGGVATYTGGSGTNALTFSYTVAPARTPRRSPPPPSISTPQPSPTAPAMPPTSRSPVSPRAARRSTPQHRPSSSLTETPSTGHLDAGNTVTLTLNLNEAVTVPAAPRRSLSMMAASPPIPAAPAAMRSPSATPWRRAEHRRARRHRGQSQFRHHHRRRRQCRQPLALRPDPERPADRHHNADLASLGGVACDRRPRCRQDRHADAQPERGGDSQRGGTPTLTLNDGGIATYTSGSGSNTLTFSYTVAAGQNTAASPPPRSISIPPPSPTAPAMPPTSRSPV